MIPLKDALIMEIIKKMWMIQFCQIECCFRTFADNIYISTMF